MSLQIIIGDCGETLKSFPDESVQCCVTSPPYFGLRDYGVDGQIGLEKTPEQYVSQLVEVFREVPRLLKNNGTLWLNLGDSYAGSGKGGRHECDAQDQRNRLKPKDLIGIPWRVAFALQADGWYLRQDIIWSKPNPMPESVRDRCTKAHEYIFLLSKADRYFYDYEAMQEPSGGWNGSKFHDGRNAIVHPNVGMNRKPRVTWEERKAAGEPMRHGLNGAAALGVGGFGGDTRNKRSVWTVATRSYKGAHFATFPPNLIKPCILAGSRAGDTVLDPFGGIGTTGMVSLELKRNAILCELNPEYAKLAEARCAPPVQEKPREGWWQK